MTSNITLFIHTGIRYLDAVVLLTERNTICFDCLGYFGSLDYLDQAFKWIQIYCIMMPYAVTDELKRKTFGVHIAQVFAETMLDPHLRLALHMFYFLLTSFINFSLKLLNLILRCLSLGWELYFQLNTTIYFNEAIHSWLLHIHFINREKNRKFIARYALRIYPVAFHPKSAPMSPIHRLMLLWALFLIILLHMPTISVSR